jgi:hypothetical protein
VRKDKLAIAVGLANDKRRKLGMPEADILLEASKKDPRYETSWHKATLKLVERCV